MASEKQAEFSPAQLDRIEDAIEGLEGGELPKELTPAMERRLHEYKDILELSRDALPLEEVPGGALDAVLEQARSGAAASQVAATPTSSSSTGLWERLRRTFVLPTLALAGSAALVLWWVRPRGEEAMSADQVALESSGKLARKDARGVAQAPRAFPDADDKPVASPKDELRPELAEAEAPAREIPGRDDNASALGDPALGGARERATSGSSPPAPTTAKPSPKKRKAGKKSKSDGFDASNDGLGPPFEPSPQSKSQPKPASPEPKAPVQPGASQRGNASDPLWKPVNVGDSYRRQGRCNLARNQYKQVTRKGSAAAKEILARAHAGIGLCDDAEGKTSEANARYAKARKLWPQISTFINSERGRSYGGKGSSKKSKAKPQAQSEAADDGK